MKPGHFRRLRRGMRLTQDDLAEQLGRHKMTISRWERGAVTIPEPVAQLMTRLAKEQKSTKRKR